MVTVMARSPLPPCPVTAESVPGYLLCQTPQDVVLAVLLAVQLAEVVAEVVVVVVVAALSLPTPLGTSQLCPQR